VFNFFWCWYTFFTITAYFNNLFPIETCYSEVLESTLGVCLNFCVWLHRIIELASLFCTAVFCMSCIVEPGKELSRIITYSVHPAFPYCDPTHSAELSKVCQQTGQDGRMGKQALPSWQHQPLPSVRILWLVQPSPDWVTALKCTNMLLQFPFCPHRLLSPLS
jgi:hypothetical protein